MRMLLLLLSAGVWGRAESRPEQLNAEAVEQFRHAHYQEAERGFRAAREGWRGSPELAREHGIAGVNLGTVLRIEGRFGEAEGVLTESLQQLERAAGRESLDTARAAAALATLYQAWGRPGEAEPLAIRSNRCFARDPNATETDRANGLVLLAAIYLEEKRFNAAAALLDEFLEGRESPVTLRVYNDLGVAALRLNDLKRAESLVRRAVEMAPRVLPEHDPLEAAARNNLAQICRFAGRYLEAEQHYREAIAIWETALGPHHPETAKGMLNLAALYHERGREAGAEDLYRRAGAIFHDAYGADHELTLVARAELAEVLRGQRRYGESRRLTLVTLPALEARLGAADPRVIRALGNYQRLLADTKH